MTEPTPDTEPFALFSAWLAEAEASEPNDPNAMTLATASPGAVFVVLTNPVDICTHVTLRASGLASIERQALRLTAQSS